MVGAFSRRPRQGVTARYWSSSRIFCDDAVPGRWWEDSSQRLRDTGSPATVNPCSNPLAPLLHSGYRGHAEEDKRLRWSCCSLLFCATFDVVRMRLLLLPRSSSSCHFRLQGLRAITSTCVGCCSLGFWKRGDIVTDDTTSCTLTLCLSL
jgi:hypothetical protein